MKKRFLAFLCLVVVLMTALIPVSSLGQIYWHAYVYTSNGKGLNVRSSMETHVDNKIGSLPYGAEVDVIGFEESDTWAQINYKGMIGYVMTRYLVRDKPAPKKPSTPSSGDTTLSFANFVSCSYSAQVRPSTPGNYVNLRWAPSKSMAIQDRLFEGQGLEVIAENGTWAQVRVTNTGKVGFILRSFLTVTPTI